MWVWILCLPPGKAPRGGLRSCIVTDNTSYNPPLVVLTMQNTSEFCTFALGHLTFPTRLGLHTELDCPTLSPCFWTIPLGHQWRQHWMFFLLSNIIHSVSHYFSALAEANYWIKEYSSIPLIYLGSKFPLQIHSEPFSPQQLSTCSNKLTLKLKTHKIIQSAWLATASFPKTHKTKTLQILWNFSLLTASSKVQCNRSQHSTKHSH